MDKSFGGLTGQDFFLVQGMFMGPSEGPPVQARPGSSRPWPEICKSGNLEVLKSGIQKVPKMNIPQNVIKIWLSRKNTTSWAHVLPFQVIFSCTDKNAKRAYLLLVFLGRPMALFTRFGGSCAGVMHVLSTGWQYCQRP